MTLEWKLMTKLEHCFLVSVNKVIVTNVLEFLKLHQILVTLSL